jgi:hypothetical protein
VFKAYAGSLLPVCTGTGTVSTIVRHTRSKTAVAVRIRKKGNILVLLLLCAIDTLFSVVGRHRVDAGSDPNNPSFNADPDPDPTPSFTHVGISEFIFIFIHSSLHFFISFSHPQNWRYWYCFD